MLRAPRLAPPLVARCAFGLAVLAAPLAAGCGGSRPPDPVATPAPVYHPPAPPVIVEATATATPEPFTLAYGASRNVDGLVVRFASVLEDSRCPADVDCVWAGRATIQLTLSGAATGAVNLPLAGMDLDPAGGEGVSSMGYQFTLHALNPYPGTGAARSGQPLTATLSVVRTGAGG